jgi:hypothetical protein
MVEIIYEPKKHSYSFVDLEVGDTFFDVDGDLMMKIGHNHYNCVMLSSGDLYILADSDYVNPVDCRIEVLDK